MRYGTTHANCSGFGYQALYNNTTGAHNSSLGAYALSNNTTGSWNVGIGRQAESTGATVSNQFTLGNTSTNNLRCNDTSISGLSDARDKAEIIDLPSEAGLQFVNSLRPVTFFWDRREWYANDEKLPLGAVPDGSKIKRNWRSWKTNSGQQMGFIAQEVQGVINGHKCLEDSMMVTTDNPDKLEFAPAHLITPLIKAVQELSAEVEALKAQLNSKEKNNGR